MGDASSLKTLLLQVLNMLSNEQRRRLEKERDSLQNEWDIRNDRLMRTQNPCY